MELSKGDIVKIIGGDVEYDDYTSGYRVNTNWNTELKINPQDNEDIIEALKDEIKIFGPIPVSEVQNFIDDDGIEVDIIGRLITLYDAHSFQRDTGDTGYVRSGDIADSTGMVRVSFWDEKAEADYHIGKVYKLENARTRATINAVELNAGKTTRVIELSDAEAPDLPSFEELEEKVFELKKITDLDEDDVNVKVVARIVELEDTREFTRQDGTKGAVRNMTSGDVSGFIDVTLWEEKTNLPYDTNEAIKIQNPYVRYNDMSNRYELSIGNSANILEPSYSELSSLPDIQELLDNLYTEKDIVSLEEEDKNVIIEGKFSQIFAQRVLIPKCPFCNRTLEEDEEECQNCGNYIDKPNYLLMVSGKISDDTGEISITFFNELAEELIGMSHDDIVELYEESEYEPGFLEDTLNGLMDYNLKLVADVTYNTYDDDTKLRPKKILAKEY